MEHKTSSFNSSWGISSLNLSGPQGIKRKAVISSSCINALSDSISTLETQRNTKKQRGTKDRLFSKSHCSENNSIQDFSFSGISGDSQKINIKIKAFFLMV